MGELTGIISNLVVVMFSLSCVTAHAFAPGRFERLKPLVKTGLVTKAGAVMALEFNDVAFDNLVAAGSAMNAELERRGFTHVREAQDDLVALVSLRRVAREVLMQRIPIKVNLASIKEMNQRLERLRLDCGMLVIPPWSGAPYFRPWPAIRRQN